MRLTVAVAVLCCAPLLAALPGLDEPWGNSEESLNATIWALGARNIVEKGFFAAKRGADVSPFGGTQGDGIYAHHPPLPVWVMTAPVALGGWEGFSRLLGAACAVSALALLWLLLRRFFEPRAALCGLAAAALSVFMLRYGRMLTTLTLATPLFLLGLELTFRRSRAVLVVIAALVLSSWDGVIGAAVLVVAQKQTRLAAAGVFSLTLGLLAWHLVDATHGVNELVWQFRWRANGDALGFGEWIESQLRNVGEGLGPLSGALLFAAPFLARDRRQLLTLAALAAPGLAMELVFRQGSFKHAFWGFNLVLPAAFAVALAVTRLPRAGPALVALQAALCITVATQRLAEEHTQNELGAVARSLPPGAELPVLARGSFHPYVSWYAGGRPKNAHRLHELPAEGLALIDTWLARELGAHVPAGPRWQVLALPELSAP